MTGPSGDSTCTLLKGQQYRKDWVSPTLDQWSQANILTPLLISRNVRSYKLGFEFIVRLDGECAPEEKKNISGGLPPGMWIGVFCF